MRALAAWSFLLVVGCDLQPPPKSKPAAQAPPPAVVAPAKEPGAVGTPVTLAECLAVGEHFAQVLIDTATDPAEKAILEQEKTRNVRRQGETCQTSNWDEATRSCFLRATTRAALQSCIAVAQPPKADGPAPAGSGSGSAAGSGAAVGSGADVQPGQVQPGEPGRPARPPRRTR